MKSCEVLEMKGRLTLQKRNTSGQIIEEIKANNNIVLTGRDLVAKMFINEPIDPISHVAVGTGSTDVNPATDTQLDNEVFRKAVNPVDPTKDLIPTDDNKVMVKITMDLDFNEPPGEAVALTEAGLFNADSGGIMYNRVVFPAINKTTDFKLTLIWEIIF